MAPLTFQVSTDNPQQFAVADSYDAAVDNGRRRPPRTVTYAEDEHANRRVRRRLSATTRDLIRNFVLTDWAVRKHLDYVSDFRFQAKTNDSGFNAELETFVYELSRPSRFDIAGRHSRERAVRISEACRVTDGDVWWLKIAAQPGSFIRGKIQGIEGDRIQLPPEDRPRNSRPEEWVNGVRVGPNGESGAVAICDRVRSRLRLNRIVGARSILQHGFFTRFDQVRGVSPVASAINWFRDTYEGCEYALAKLKLSQLYGLKFTRSDTGAATGEGTMTPTRDADGDGTADSEYEVNLGGGPFTLDLHPGDNAEVIESHTPSSETVNYLKFMVHMGIKALDIPYSFFDESFTNFYGSRGGLIQYLKSCRPKIADLQEFQDNWLIWRLGIAVADGELTLPSGKEFNWLDWEFVPAGVPWWDPVKEARGQAMAIAMGVSSPQRVCREVGTDFETNIDEISAAMKYAVDKGVPLTFADSSAFAPEITVQGNSDE